MAGRCGEVPGASTIPTYFASHLVRELLKHPGGWGVFISAPRGEQAHGLHVSIVRQMREIDCKDSDQWSVVRDQLVVAGVGACFPTLRAQNARRMGHGGFVLFRHPGRKDKSAARGGLLLRWARDHLSGWGGQFWCWSPMSSAAVATFWVQKVRSSSSAWRLMLPEVRQGSVKVFPAAEIPGSEASAELTQRS